jgi:hypothetical protein
MSWGWNDADGNTGYDASVFTEIDHVKPDDLGIVAAPLAGPSRVSLREVREVPLPEDIGLQTSDLPEDFPQAEDEFDEDVYPGMKHVVRSKLGGWPHWVQDPEWPPAVDGEQVVFVCQLDWALCERAAWGGGGYAYLFVETSRGKPPTGELTVQTT